MKKNEREACKNISAQKDVEKVKQRKLQTKIIAGEQRKKERWCSSLLTEQVALFGKRETPGKFNPHLPPQAAVRCPQRPGKMLSSMTVCHHFFLNSKHTLSYHTCWETQQYKWQKGLTCWRQAVIGWHSWITSRLRKPRWYKESLLLYQARMWTDTHLIML